MLYTAALPAATPPSRACERVEYQGQVSEGQEWKTSLGQGWIFRLLPIAGFSGWDLAVDRDAPAGYPDALLLATPPYNSISEREIGTTFGLRAQDAIGWNPRSFHFLTNPVLFHQAQGRFRQLAPAARETGSAPPVAGNAEATRQLLQLRESASSGQLRILDARLVPGLRDPQPFAQNWALAYSRTPHQVEQVSPGQASPEGRIAWIRFSLTLWMPAGWKFSPGLHPVRVNCPE